MIDRTLCEPCGYKGVTSSATKTRGMDNTPVCDWHATKSWQTIAPEPVAQDNCNHCWHIEYVTRGRPVVTYKCCCWCNLKSEWQDVQREHGPYVS